MDGAKWKSKRLNDSFAVKWTAQRTKKGNSNWDEAKRLQTTSVIMWPHCTVPTTWKCVLYSTFCLKLPVCIPTRSSSSQPEFFCTYYSIEHGVFFSTLPKGVSHVRCGLIEVSCPCRAPSLAMAASLEQRRLSFPPFASALPLDPRETLHPSTFG